MLAIQEQTTIDPTTSSTVDSVTTVTYDPVNQVITATVIVGFDTATADFLVYAPPIAIPKGVGSSSWTVLWNVVPDATLQSASFRSASEGVEIPGQNIPAGVTLTMLGEGQSLEQWQATIENAVTVVGSFGYTVSVTGIPVGTTSPMFKTQYPTIVVTPDPIGG